MIHDLAMPTLGLLLMVLIGWTLYRENKDHRSPIRLTDLLLGEDGRMSKAAGVMWVSLAVTSWTTIYLATHGQLDNIIFAAYAATWVAPVLAKLFQTKADSDTPNPPLPPKTP